MITLHESEVDGVLCFWVETGRPTLAASLLFRQGMADEPLHESGWLHLLEHMVLHDTGSGSLHVNGSVSPLITTFDTHGPRDAVAQHLTRITSWLGDPELRRLSKERGVLHAESSLRGGPLVNSLRWRYGAQGPGVASYNELGLTRAEPAALWDLSRKVFNRGNAVLVLDGPPPTNLRIGLTDGSFRPPAAAVSIEKRYPAAYEENAGLVLSGVVERTHEAGIATALLERALRKEIRDRAGAGYAPWSAYEPVDAESAVVAAGSDLRPDILPTILEKSLLVLERLQGGAPSGWIEEQVEARLQALHDPYNAMAVAMRAGHAVLSDKVPMQYQELIVELEQPDRAKIRDAFDQLRSTLLLGAPASSRLPTRIRRAEYPSTTAWRDAPRHRHRNWPSERARMSVGRSGVEVVTTRDALQVPLDQTAALLAWKDGTRSIIGRDGWSLYMAPAEWRGGAALARAMDELVTPELHLPMDGAGSRSFSRLSWRRRWLPRLRRSLFSASGLALLAVVLCAAGLFAAGQQRRGLGVTLLVLAAVSIFSVPRAFFAGRRRLW